MQAFKMSTYKGVALIDKVEYAADKQGNHERALHDCGTQGDSNKTTQRFHFSAFFEVSAESDWLYLDDPSPHQANPHIHTAL